MQSQREGRRVVLLLTQQYCSISIDLWCSHRSMTVQDESDEDAKRKAENNTVRREVGGDESVLTRWMTVLRGSVAYCLCWLL